MCWNNRLKEKMGWGSLITREVVLSLHKVFFPFLVCLYVPHFIEWLQLCTSVIVPEVEIWDVLPDFCLALPDFGLPLLFPKTLSISFCLLFIQICLKDCFWTCHFCASWLINIICYRCKLLLLDRLVSGHYNIFM